MAPGDSRETYLVDLPLYGCVSSCVKNLAYVLLSAFSHSYLHIAYLVIRCIGARKGSSSFS